MKKRETKNRLLRRHIEKKKNTPMLKHRKNLIITQVQTMVLEMKIMVLMMKVLSTKFKKITNKKQTRGIIKQMLIDKMNIKKILLKRNKISRKRRKL